MKLIKQQEANVFPNSAECIAIEYPFGDSDINAAVIKLDGRYPQQGYAVNTKCKEIAYVIEGKGKIYVKQSSDIRSTFVELDSTSADKQVPLSGKASMTYSLVAGDCVFLNPNEAYAWEGTMTLFMPCSPAWSPEQHEIITI